MPDDIMPTTQVFEDHRKRMSVSYTSS